MKVLVIYGGYGLSEEALVSEKSGERVLKACKEVGIDAVGFKLTSENVYELKSEVVGYDVVLPILHGSFGEDGQIQKILDDLGIKYLGSGEKSSKICFDKIVTKEILKNNNILTPEWGRVTTEKDLDNIVFPAVVKPNRGGSSIGVVIAKNRDDLKNLDLSEPLMTEEYIEGQELTVGILGNQALSVVEIIPNQGEWFDFKNKYNNLTQENVPPKHLSQDIQKQAQELALKVHQVCGCRHLSRVDMILKDNQLYVLEINTMPGLTEESLYPKSAKAMGLSMPKLIEQLANSANK